MVFTNLTDEDKEAFFALLDEYFSSRPELAEALNLQAGNQPPIKRNLKASLFAGHTLDNHPQAASAAASAAQRAFANNPQATSAVASAGLRAAVPKSSPFHSVATNPEVSNAVGRVAAATLAFNGGNTSSSRPPPPPGPNAKDAASSSDLRPPPPPRRSTSNSSTSAASAADVPPSPLPPPRTTPATRTANGLVSQRKLGDIDLSAGQNMLRGMRNKEAPVPTAPSPSALPPAKAKLPPPPRRGVLSKPRTPTPEPEVEDEQEYEGEWAEALYDYKSTDPNDLPLQAEQRVLVTARTSDDWWTGEADGKSGLFPASYVKIL